MSLKKLAQNGSDGIHIDDNPNNHQQVCYYRFPSNPATQTEPKDDKVKSELT